MEPVYSKAGIDRVEAEKDSQTEAGGKMTNQEQVELLKQGVEAWNQWRRNHPEIIPDLSESNITRLDLSGINFSRAILNGSSLSRLDLSEANFAHSDLSDAFLSESNLKGANFDNAKLIGAVFKELGFNKAILTSANLKNARFSKTNLSEANLSKVNLSEANLTGLDLSNVNLLGAYLNGVNLTEAYLNGANLRGLDLTKANLTGADLSSADLSEALLNRVNFSRANLNGLRLKYADLRYANLSKTQLLGTDFTTAKLTGACIEDWNINSETKLDGVICEYVYLKRDKQERCPSSGSFKPGEFTTLSRKALDTVDLIFADGINWQVFFQSFQELRSQHDEDNISIQAIEKKSGGAFVVRLEVPVEAHKGEIERHVKEIYEMKLQLQEQRYRAELQAKDGQISTYQEHLEFHRQNNTNLMGIVKTMAEKETNQTTIHANNVGFVNSGSGTVSDFSQNIGNNIDDITKLINSLRDTAKTFPEQQREEALVHLDDLQEDLSQPEKQKPQRIKTRLVALFAIVSTASGVVIGATDFGNKVLDLSKKLGIELVHLPSNSQLPPSK